MGLNSSSSGTIRVLVKIFILSVPFILCFAEKPCSFHHLHCVYDGLLPGSSLQWLTSSFGQQRRQGRAMTLLQGCTLAAVQTQLCQASLSLRSAEGASPSAASQQDSQYSPCTRRSLPQQPAVKSRVADKQPSRCSASWIIDSNPKKNPKPQKSRFLRAEKGSRVPEETQPLSCVDHKGA